MENPYKRWDSSDVSTSSNDDSGASNKNLRANTPNHPIRKRDHIWKKSVVRVFKINVDASFHADNFMGSCGVIARDDHGKFLGAATHLFTACGEYRSSGTNRYSMWVKSWSKSGVHKFESWVWRSQCTWGHLWSKHIYGNRRTNHSWVLPPVSGVC